MKKHMRQTRRHKSRRMRCKKGTRKVRRGRNCYGG